MIFLILLGSFFSSDNNSKDTKTVVRLLYVPELRGMRDESRPGTGRDGMKKFANLVGWDEIGLIHYSVSRILVKRNRLKILWVHRILTRSKH